MSVLICPVCQGQMKEVERQGVLIDTCSQCRGVWLDRGELEKLAGVLSSAESPSSRHGITRVRDHDDDERKSRHDRRDDRDRHDERPRSNSSWTGALFGEQEDDDGHDRRGRSNPQRSRRSSFLDFFD